MRCFAAGLVKYVLGAVAVRTVQGYGTPRGA